MIVQNDKKNKDSVPLHVAIILDGNRRYAKKLGLKPWMGHEYGIKKIEELTKWCRDLGINELTLYCFSTENFRRTKIEKDYLFRIFKKKFESIEYEKDTSKYDIKIRVIGKLEMFPKNIRDLMIKIMKKTEKHKKFIINFAMAYGGRQEITEAVKSITKKIKSGEININSINENLITKNLYLKNDVDLVIRPGGEHRISNFLLWQSSYSEFFFVNKLWPEFTKEDLIDCINKFKKRNRRFGR